MSRLILCLGFHRSGTSLITHALESLGVDLGDRLMGPATDNPHGFYEDLDILNLDQLALKAVGAEWFTVEPVAAKLAQLARSDYGNQVEMVLRAKIADRPVFGIKDPRLCRLLPFWRPVFARMGLDVSVVHVVRHPAACAQSLEKRNKIPPEVAMNLWYLYNYEALAFAGRTWPRVVVDYDIFIRQPLHELNAMATGLKLKLDIEKAQRLPIVAPDGLPDVQLPHHGDVNALWGLLHKMATVDLVMA